MASSQKQEKIELPPIAGKLFWLQETDSTQLESRRLIDAGQRIPFVVLADCQTAGRGRFMRKWLSPPGGLYFSWATQFVPYPAVSLAAGIGVLSAVKKFCSGKIFLKWPNDILTDGGKVAGILAEKYDDVLILGVGVNLVGAGEFPGLGIDPARKIDLLTEIFRRMDEIWTEFAAEGFRRFVRRYLELTFPPGTPITVVDGSRTFSGVFENITPGGELVLRVGDKSLKFSAGEVSLRL